MLYYESSTKTAWGRWVKCVQVALSVAVILFATGLYCSAQTENVLYSFTGTNGDGQGPNGPLVMDAAGNLFGTTFSGGSGSGIVYELVKGSSGYTETVLYTFSGPDGAIPAGGLVMDASGNLYGVASGGGADGCGLVFELAKSSSGYAEKTIYTFTGQAMGDGASPYAGLIMDGSGNLFGTTSGGGIGGGTVYELVNSSGSYTEKVLYSFTGENGDGAQPKASLAMDSSGNLFGTTYGGGTLNNGTVFELANSSGSYSEQVLYGFRGSPSDGGNPLTALVIDSSGDLFGTTFYGGQNYSGVAYEMVNSSSGYYETVLFNFNGNSGQNPFGGLLLDKSGNLFGATQSSTDFTHGCYSNCGGLAYELVNSSGSYYENILHNFASFTGDGSETPYNNSYYYYLGGGSLIMDASGNLYGTTPTGGTAGDGAVFEINPTATAPEVQLSYTTLSFVGQVMTTLQPQSVSLTNTGNANLVFGASALAISGPDASDFAITSDGCSGLTISPSGTCTVTLTFSPASIGSAAASLEIADNASNTPQTVSLSGVGLSLGHATFSPSALTFPSQTVGTTSNSQPVKLSNAGTGPLGITSITTSSDAFAETNNCPSSLGPGASCTINVSFTPPFAGAISENVLVKTDEAVYPDGLGLSGTGSGLSATGATLTVLHTFGGQLPSNDGSSPYAGLLEDSSGNLFGTTANGGANGAGTVFELVKASGGYTEGVLYNFTYTNGDALYPLAGLVMDGSGDLFGVAANGGNTQHGAVFELVKSSTGYTEKVIYSLTGGDVSESTTAGLVIDSSGNLFGTTPLGGPTNAGTVYELVNSSGSYTEKVLYSFTGINGDGSSPQAGLVMDGSGNLFGTTFAGGANGNGAVFELVKSSGGYSENVLYSFGGGEVVGDSNGGSLLMDSSGDLFGATSNGGPNLSGTVFELVKSAAGYTESDLYSFGASSGDGSQPHGGVVMDRSGDLFGTTSEGGTGCISPLLQPTGCGTVFELVRTAAGYAEKVLYRFNNDGDGSIPESSLVLDASSGSLFGTAYEGGAYSGGTAFEITPLPAAGVALSAYSLGFGTLGVGTASSALTVTVTNVGTGNLTFAAGAVTVTGPDAADFAISSDTCTGQTVTPNGTCAVGMTFDPSRAGAEMAALDFADNAATSPQTVALSGTGLGSAVTLSSVALTFSPLNVGTTSAAQSVTVTNSGASALAFAAGAVTVAGPDAADFAIASDTCSGQSIAPNSTCAVGVTFDPSRGGSESATLTLADNATGSPQTVALSGTGQDFKLGEFTTSETVTAGTTAPFEFQLSPQGGFTGTVSFTCSGAPSNSTCTVTPSSVTVSGSGPQDIALNVATTAPSAVIPVAPDPPAIPPAALWLALAGLMGLLAIGIRRWPARAIHESALRRKKPQTATALLFAAGLLMFVALAASCGGGGTAPVVSAQNSGATPSGTYTLTVTATSGSISKSASVSLIVK